MTASLIRPGTGTVSAQNLAYLDEHLRRYIASGTLAGTLVVVYHKGQVAHWSAQGLRDRERGKPVTDDTIFRIYSMTKPITSVALMQLYERGLVQLDDPVHRYSPSLAKLRVYQSGSYPNFQTTPCERPMQGVRRYACALVLTSCRSVLSLSKRRLPACCICTASAVSNKSEEVMPRWI